MFYMIAKHLYNQFLRSKCVLIQFIQQILFIILTRSELFECPDGKELYTVNYSGTQRLIATISCALVQTLWVLLLYFNCMGPN